MKKQKITIITSDAEIVFDIEKPETSEESHKGLAGRKKLPEKHGMIYFFERGGARVWTPETEFHVDFIFIDSFGDIVKIVHNAEPFSKKIYECSYGYAVLEINGGECKKFGIQEEDSVISSEFYLSSNNLYPAHGLMFQKLNSRTIDSINMEDIAFLSYAEGGAMGWHDSMIMFLKNKNGIEKYAISGVSSLEKDGKRIDEIFEPFKDYAVPFFQFSPIIDDTSRWVYSPLGYGNHLYIRKEFWPQFKEELIKESVKHSSEVYGKWCKIAYNILTDKLDIKSIEGRKYWKKQKYFGIDTANLDKVFDSKWWETLDMNEFFLMKEDGDYLKIHLQNSDDTVLDLAIKYCKNKEIIEILKYEKEKNQDV